MKDSLFKEDFEDFQNISVMFQFLTYILSPITHLYYGITFGIFHIAQVIAHRFVSEKARLKVIVWLNFFLTKALYIVGSRVKVKGLENIPDTSRPIIIVSNHQSFYDIPIIAHLFRKHNVKYVAKASLGKGIPTISYNLVHGGSALVDRDNGAQSVRAIFKLGRHIEENNYAACIYPEGTRSESYKVQEFQSAGIGTLLRSAPSALIVPFAIKGHSDLISKSNIWLGIGKELEYKIFPSIDPKGKELTELVDNLHTMIKETVEEAY